MVVVVVDGVFGVLLVPLLSIHFYCAVCTNGPLAPTATAIPHFRISSLFPPSALLILRSAKKVAFIHH